ncbi:Transcriptional regulator [Novosphingobium sp. 9U]|nr:Transcriptional regulator [Novosphingobium sp. 9U]
MPDPSNPTARVMDVLKFLAAHPTETFTLAEIARHVGLSNGSAHRLLTTMAAGQFLSRNEKHRTYSLGIALVAIGQAAIAKHQGIEIARRELARLAVDLRAQCSANCVAEGDIVVLVKEGSAQSHLGLTRVGERRPLVPPVGLCHIAWGSNALIEDYLGKAEPFMAAPLRDHLRAALPLIRERGYAICANGPGAAASRQALVMASDQVRDAAYWARVHALVGELSADEIQLIDFAAAEGPGISYIAAPVFSPAATVAFQLVATGFPTDMNVREIEACARRLCATAAIVTAEMHGRVPAV